MAQEHKRMDKVQLNKRQKDMLFYLSLVVLGLLLFRIPGNGQPIMYDDSYSYMTITRYVEGVMPVYPFFLQLNRFLFGENTYLMAVTWEQAVFATLCVLAFIKMLQSKFDLPYWAVCGCFLLAMLPFITDLPEGMTTQAILTEGIAYATFYLFMAAVLQAIWKKSIVWTGIALVVEIFMAATRSQLQILYGVCGLLFCYVIVAKYGKRGSERLLLGLLGIITCFVISLAGIRLTGRISSAYQMQTAKNAARAVAAEKAAAQMANQDVGTEENEVQEAASKQENTASEYVTTSQYITLIYSRGMYEADAEDCVLFDGESRRIFEIMYQAVDEDQCRYAYYTPGLWAWKDIAGGIGRVGEVGNLAQLSDYKDNLQEAFDSNVYNGIRSQTQMQIGIALLKEHFGRFLYHTLLLMPQAFISTVFFQIAPIYLLCHLITLFLYLSAIALMVWAFRDKKADNRKAAFMAVVLGVNLVLVGVISIIFFGQQRYLVYNFGIFYISYFMLLLELWETHGKSWITGWKEKRKS